MNYFYAFCFIFFSVYAQAQTYLPFVEADKKWYVHVVQTDASEGVALTIGSDTLIDSQLYKQWVSMYCDSIISLEGFIREDSLHSKLWYRGINDTAEQLIMDLDLRVSDTFTYTNEYSETDMVTVVSIDTIQGRKRILFDKIRKECTASFAPDISRVQFIEGIGPSFLFWENKLSMFTHDGLCTFLACSAIQDSTAFESEDVNEFAPYCQLDCLLLSVEDTKPLALKIYPNPAGDVIHIDFLNTPTTMEGVEIYDISGKLINVLAMPQNQQSTIDISFLPKSVYLFVFKTPQSIYTKKVVKK